MRKIRLIWAISCLVLMCYVIFENNRNYFPNIRSDSTSEIIAKENSRNAGGILMEVNSLIDIANKEISQYTLSDCTLILNTTFSDLFAAFGINYHNEPSGGLLLPNTTLSHPVVFLKNEFAVTGYLTKDHLESTPLAIFLWNFDSIGAQCPVEGYRFGDVLDAESPYLNNGFIKYSESSEEEPINQIEIIKDDIKITLYYEKIESNEDSPYHLTTFCAELLEPLYGVIDLGGNWTIQPQMK